MVLKTHMHRHFWPQQPSDPFQEQNFSNVPHTFRNLRDPWLHRCSAGTLASLPLPPLLWQGPTQAMQGTQNWEAVPRLPRSGYLSEEAGQRRSGRTAVQPNHQTTFHAHLYRRCIVSHGFTAFKETDGRMDSIYICSH